MAMTLAERKAAILKNLMGIGSARRGRLYPQYHKYKRSDGRIVKLGPYYVLQHYKNGVQRYDRVKCDQIFDVQAELERGQQVKALFEELWEVLEQASAGHDRPEPRPPTAQAQPRRTRRAAALKRTSA